MLKSKGNPLKVHSKVHFLKMNYSIGFYTGGGNIDDWGQLSKDEQKVKLSKAWYVRWSYRDPETGLLVRQQPNIKYGINIHKTKSSRLKAMLEIKRELTKLLKSGFSPYEFSSAEPLQISIEYAFLEILKIKIKETKESTFKDYRSRFNTFELFLNKNGFKYIKEVDKKIVSTFLNKYSSKNSNNFRAVISSGFSTLSDLDIIDYNFIREIKPKKTLDKQVKIHDEKIIEKSLKLLHEQDKILLMYIYFVSYMFWRPIEVVRLDINDIDFDKNIMSVETKAKAKKTKIIPNIILEKTLEFTKNRKGKVFNLNAKSNIDKRGYLTNRFSKFRDRNNLPKDLTPYSFRHFNITKAYLDLRKHLSIEDSIKELKLITGHTSKAITKYIHVNDLELPEDYSHMFNKK